MGLSGKLWKIIVPGVLIMSAIVAAAAAATMAKNGCRSDCGGVEIPYPFGLTEGCYRDRSFHITCQSGKPKTDNITVRSISIETHEMHVATRPARDCYTQDGVLDSDNSANSSWLRAPQYTISSTNNKFTIVGCDTYGFLRGYQNGEKYSIGCSSECPSLRNVVNGTCSGVGCCETGFPDGLNNITVDVFSWGAKHYNVWNFNPCGYAFVMEKGEFNFSASYLKDLPNEELPLVFDWAVGNLPCAEARNKEDFACKKNSECLDPKTRKGYRCKCKQGYKRNPYLDGGCQGTYVLYIYK
jgi:hypothetical protein